jgi:hypothetical protein
MSTHGDSGILCAITEGCDQPRAEQLYTPIRVIVAGASFETINGSVQDRPHTSEYLQAIMAPLGHVLKHIGAPGASVVDLTAAITAHEANILNADDDWYKADAGILGLSGAQIQDSYAPPYTTLAEVSTAIDAFARYTHRQYAIRPPRTVGIDWCWIRSYGQFTDAKWDAYVDAWDAHMAANHPDVGVIDAYAVWEDSKEYAFAYAPWGDWHLSTESAARGARVIWDRIRSEITPQEYYPPDWSPILCPEIPK